MNLKAFFTWIVLVLLACISYGQNPSKEVLRVTVAPLSLLDPRAGVLQVGLQKKLSERVALAVDYGLRCNVLSYYRNSEREDYRYYKAKVEAKYFFRTTSGNRSNLNHPYIAAQVLYFPQRYRKDSSWLLTGDKDYFYQTSDIDRQVGVASVLAGDEEVWNKVVLDYYFGLGLRRMTISHRPTGAVESHYSEPREIGGRPVDLFEGTFYRPHIVLGFKVGYSFRN